MAAIPPEADLSSIPAALNPNGGPPNFTDPPNQENLVLAVGLPLVILSLAFVSMRVAMNLSMTRRLLADDYMCLFALVTVIPYWALGVSFKATARHAWDVPLSFLDASYLKRSFAFNFLAGPTFWAAKVAIFLLYLRVFAPKRWLRWTCYVVIVATFFLYWVSVPLSGAWCTPRKGGPWTLATTQECSKIKVLGPLHGAVSVVVDLIIIVLPLPIVYQLQLKTGRKLGLAMVFLVGIFALVASLISLYYRVRIYETTDPFWDSPKITACAVAECTVTIIVSCAPSFSAFWNHTLTKSTFYSNVRTALSRSRSRHSYASSGKLTGSSIPKAVPRVSGSSSQLFPDRSSYYELDEHNNGKVATTVQSDGYKQFRPGNVIQKSTTFDQRSDRSYV